MQHNNMSQGEAVENRTAAAAQTTPTDGGGGGERMSNNTADSDNRFHLAQKVCEAMEQREYSQLSSLLNVSTTLRDNDNDGIATGENIDDNNLPSFECQQILQVFYSSIGRNDDDSLNNNTAVNSEEIIIPLNIKSHLLLRALLHPTIHQNYCNSSQYSQSWEAVVAAIQSIQYSSPQSTTHGNNTNSVSEEMAMITEIRHFVTNLRSGGKHTYNTNNNNNDGDQHEIIGNVTNTLECLSELGLAIIAPLLIHRNDIDVNNRHKIHQPIKRINSNEIHKGNNSYIRREQSYLLPLELLPGILASLDSLDDLLADLIVARQQQQQEEVEWEHREFVDMNVDVEMNIDVNDDDDNNESSVQDHNDGDDAEMHIRYSDKLLSAFYVPFNANHDKNNNGGVDKSDKLHRSIRADASLPLLALAIDDIGIDRMAMTVPMMRSNEHDDGITYWDCLALSLHHVIQSNLLCYAKNDERELNDEQEQIINEATNDEGMHLIAPSDYPALIRCVFRMIATISPSNNNNNKSEHTLGWESLLLQLYHAAAVVSAKLPTIKSLRPRRTNSASDHHSATLSTVESHVLLPSFTGASVTAIRSVLDSCRQESCTSCKRISGNTTWWQRFTNDAATPNWAVAGIV
eukprot:scaffold11127_cov104-Skeletonema_marinoi.AAC.1